MWGVDWPAAEPIETARLMLEPLRVDHAGEMREVLGDPALYAYTGGNPPSLDELRTRYAGVPYQRRGFAIEAAAGMVGWLGNHGVQTFTAHIHPDHTASMGVARRLGLTATDVIEGGETGWEARSRSTTPSSSCCAPSA